MTNPRTCIGCRAQDTPRAMVRVVKVDESVVVDVDRCRGGRGAWLHPTSTCLDAAERRRAFTRALRANGALDTSAVRDWVHARV